MLGKREDEKKEVRVPLLGDGFSFDELTSGVASGSISRGQAMKLAGGALMGAALLPFAASEADAKKKKNRCKGKPALSNERCVEEEALCRPLTEDRICVCAKERRTGKKRCVNIANEDCPETDECDRSEDCPGKQICIEVAGCCSEQTGNNNLCVPPC